MHAQVWLLVHASYLWISWHDMKLKVTLEIPLINKARHLSHLILGLVCRLHTIVLLDFLCPYIIFTIMWKMTFQQKTWQSRIQRLFLDTIIWKGHCQGLAAWKMFCNLWSLRSPKNEFWGIKHLIWLPLLLSSRTLEWVKTRRDGS